MTDPLDIRDLIPANAWHAYVDAWCNGWAAGVDEGRRRADAEAAARHRAASSVVLAMTKVPEVDRSETAARRRRWDARFGGDR